VFHLVARTLGRRPLFHDWHEGAALWLRATAAVPGLAAFVLMPDHLHLVHPHDVRLRLAAALGDHVRWMHARRGTHGRWLEPLPPAEPLVDATKARRTVRYVHLNPCRAHLAVDPLAWPFSTHRDRLGCAARPVLPQARDPEAFHRYVSSDPSVDPTGTPLPARALATRDLERLAEAVSSAARTPLGDLRARGPARTLFLSSAATLAPEVPRHEVAAWAGVSRHAAWRAARCPPGPVDAVARCLGDDRLRALAGRVGRR
jgi:REP element-mobilizing transposase RayT